MPLVYLDTSHLSLLARAHSRGDSCFSDFHARWITSGAELAVTRTHLWELRQHDNAFVRDGRYALFERLLPIHSDVVTREPVAPRLVLLQEREIVRALYATGELSIQSDSPQVVREWRRRYLDVFPEMWSDQKDVATARVFEDHAFGATALQMRDAMRAAATAQHRPRASRYRQTRLQDLSASPVSAVDTQLAYETLADAISKIDMATLLPHFPPASVRELFEKQMEQARLMIARAADVGVRQAYLEAMSLTAIAEDNRYLDEVSDDLLFRSHARSALESLGIPCADASIVAGRISVVACPGFWLTRAVNLEMRKAEPEPKASNSYDLDHVIYAPYVSLFFTDKRVAGYINAIRKRPGAIARVAAMPAVVATAGHVSAVTEALRALEKRRVDEPF